MKMKIRKNKNSVLLHILSFLIITFIYPSPSGAELPNNLTSIPGLTASAPALAWNPVANEMQIVVMASTGSLWAASFDSGGTFKNDWVPLPGITVGTAPALVWDDSSSELYMTGRAPDNTIWSSTFNSNGFFNNDWANVSGTTVSSPAAAYVLPTGDVHIAVRASDDSLWTNLYHQPPPLVEPLVTFTFDDANDTDYTLALPLFQSKGIVGVSNIVTDNVGTTGCLTWDQIVALQNAGWEIASHTVSHPDLTQLDAAGITTELSDSKNILISHGLVVKNLAYPFGDYNDLVRSIVPNYYRSARAVYNNGNINFAPLDTTALSAAEYNNTTSLDIYKGYIDQAKSLSAWLIFYAHAIDATDVDRIGQLIDYVLQNNIRIVTKDAALTLYGVPDIP